MFFKILLKILLKKWATYNTNNNIFEGIYNIKKLLVLGLISYQPSFIVALGRGIWNNRGCQVTTVLRMLHDTLLAVSVSFIFVLQINANNNTQVGSRYYQIQKFHSGYKTKKPHPHVVLARLLIYNIYIYIPILSIKLKISSKLFESNLR